MCSKFYWLLGIYHIVDNKILLVTVTLHKLAAISIKIRKKQNKITKTHYFIEVINSHAIGGVSH